MMNTVRLTFLILLILILVFGSLFFMNLPDLPIGVHTASPGSRYSTSVAWLEVCTAYLSEPLVAFHWF